MGEKGWRPRVFEQPWLNCGCFLEFPVLGRVSLGQWHFQEPGKGSCLSSGSLKEQQPLFAHPQQSRRRAVWGGDRRCLVCVGGSLTLPRGSPCCTMPWRNVLVPWREKERAPHLPLTLARVGCNPMSSLRPGRRHHWWVSLMPCRVTSWCSARPLRLCLVCLISEGFSACLHPFPSPLPLFWSKGQARDEDHFALKRTSSAEINLGSLCRIWSGRNPGLEVGWGNGLKSKSLTSYASLELWALRLCDLKIMLWGRLGWKNICPITPSIMKIRTPLLCFEAQGVLVGGTGCGFPNLWTP